MVLNRFCSIFVLWVQAFVVCSLKDIDLSIGCAGKVNIILGLPEVAAGMYDEVADGFLTSLFLQQSVAAAEQLQCKSVVCHLEHGTQLISEVPDCVRFIARRRRRPSDLAFRSTVVRRYLLGRLGVGVCGGRPRSELVQLAAAFDGRVN